MQRRTATRLLAVAGLGLTIVGVSACSTFTEGRSNDTLAPLTAPGPTAPPITQSPVANTQGPVVATTTSVPAPVADDDTDAQSVAARFLAAVAAGDQSTAQALEAAGRGPTVATWAAAQYDQYTKAAGPAAWGTPTCDEPAGSTTVCSWLTLPQVPTLALVLDGTTWRVSHGVFNSAATEAASSTGTACVVGDEAVNYRGGPGRDWPNFNQIPPGSCDVTVFDVTETEPSSGDTWRMIERAGERGWVIERVLRYQ